MKPAEAPRVSTRRQGETATKIRLVLDVALGEELKLGSASIARASRSTWLGCQYRGEAQFFKGAGSSWRRACAFSDAEASS